MINVSDFENYIKNNFSNVIYDIKVVDNTDYINGHLDYLREIGLSEPNSDSRILFNQINFSNSCNFNNVYIYCIPKVPQNEYKNFNKFLSIGLKNKIKDYINPIKILTSEIVFQDPVYVAVGLGVASSDEIFEKTLYPEIVSETKLVINKTPKSYANNSLIIDNVYTVFSNFFNDQNMGKKIDVEYINNSLLAINGIESFSTERVVNGQTISINGLSFIVYNPIYYSGSEDIKIISQSLILPFFKASYYVDYDELKRNIVIKE